MEAEMQLFRAVALSNFLSFDPPYFTNGLFSYPRTFYQFKFGCLRAFLYILLSLLGDCHFKNSELPSTLSSRNNHLQH